MAYITAAYVVLGIYLAGVCGAGVLGAVQTVRAGKKEPKNKVHEHYVAGAGLATITWFFTMSASLFSGYSVSGIVAEAYNLGWVATRWIPAGVGVYMGFLLLAPRLHALGKSRGYVTISEFIYDRYLPPSGAPWVAHSLRIGSFLALQLPIFTYLITQFQALGTEVRTFTAGGISATTAVLVAAGILLVCDLLGGMRAVAYTDVLQGVILIIGSAVFLVVQRTELGGLPAAATFYRDPANAGLPNVALMRSVPPAPTIVAYFDFVFKTTIAATMFPHLSARLFAARNEAVMQRGMACMNFTFFIVQLSSMITGWVAISALAGSPMAKGTNIFSAVLLRVAERGVGQSVFSALLLASACCAMMSTADSALLAFSSMWVRDMFKPYIAPRSSETTQLWFGRAMAVVGLTIGVSLGLLTIEKGFPNLTGLFSLQNVTPIHVAPAVWLGLHWRTLRGEAVAAGMFAGLATTVGLVFSPINVRLAAGLDQTASGLSTALIGFFVNITVTVVLGLLLQARPGLLATCGDGARAGAAPGHVSIAPGRCRMLNPWLWAAMLVVLLFTVPFCWRPLSLNPFIGDMAAWPFVALVLSGVLALMVASAYMLLWEDYGDQALPRRAGSDMKFDQQLASGASDVVLNGASKDVGVVPAGRMQ